MEKGVLKVEEEWVKDDYKGEIKYFDYQLFNDFFKHGVDESILDDKQKTIFQALFKSDLLRNKTSKYYY